MSSVFRLPKFRGHGYLAMDASHHPSRTAIPAPPSRAGAAKKGIKKRPDTGRMGKSPSGRMPGHLVLVLAALGISPVCLRRGRRPPERGKALCSVPILVSVFLRRAPRPLVKNRQALSRPAQREVHPDQAPAPRALDHDLPSALAKLLVKLPPASRASAGNAGVSRPPPPFQGRPLRPR